MRKTIIVLAAALLAGALACGARQNKFVTGDAEFLRSPEAYRIGVNVLAYQRATGGWPKNVDMAARLSDAELAAVMADKGRTDDSTTDNGATTAQLRYLAVLYQANADTLWLRPIHRGIEYLLSGQYPNGGWPQFWPGNRGYQKHITYNDGAMQSTLEVIRAYRDGVPPFQNLVTRELKARLDSSYRRGIECILATQIRVDGKPTVWCQQHDSQTLLPAKARAYELPSFCSAESVGLVRLLMELPEPDSRVIEAVKGAMEWFDAHKITGYRLERIGEKGKPGADTRLVADASAPALWARFYDMQTGQPFVCDRDGIPRRSLREIGEERRNGYSWYTTAPSSLYPLYDAWKAEHGIK